ncbi:MAG: hypothetical protein KR126chlam2_00757 [Chlamydiae bacterium]|nr:hypothetical protein [Chlamydiota bacterium]
MSHALLRYSSRGLDATWHYCSRPHHPAVKFFKKTGARDRIFKVTEAVFEGIIPLMGTPLVGASEEAIGRAVKIRAGLKISRTCHAMFFNLLGGAVQRTVSSTIEAGKLAMSIKNGDPFILKSDQEWTVYKGRVEKTLGFFSKIFEVIKNGAYLGAMGPPRIIGSLEKLLDEDFASPYHEIGQTYEIFALLRNGGKIGGTLTRLILEGIHYKRNGVYYRYYSKSKCSEDGARKTTEKGFQRIDDKDPMRRLAEFISRMTDHILALLESVPKLAVHIINMAQVAAPPIVKAILHIFSATIGLVIVVRSAT